MNKLYVVGIGPGNEEGMTIRARKVLDECRVIAGYKTYIDLVKPFLSDDKEYIETGMRAEEERCRMALEAAADRTDPVCMICSGDAGIYGMAGIVYELAGEYEGVSVEVIPGVSAALSGSALLGAAVGHDCAIISLSDLLTPWELIEKRIRAAAEGDFVIVLYNPASRKRAGYLKRACDIVSGLRSGDTVCGYVRNIGRDGESVTVTNLNELGEAAVDMFTTVFIGNSMTKNIDGHMVTPRGYRL
ncbi:MAG: precorrin-3B C(17)-methyltransferase [Lachnospiraceae bacterium]|nr:precorrin-3B C(17)-methyltransferase [Lachnospiraceae bacterium]